MDGRQILEAPFRLLGGIPGTTRGAVANARDAALTIAAAVTERRELTIDLTSEPASEPGVLRALTKAECYALLGRNEVGRLAYLARVDAPDIAPVNYVFDGTDVLIRSGPGPKLQAAERGDKVAFEVDEVDPVHHRGCSVVVYGTAAKIGRDERGTQPPEGTPVPWADGPRHHTIRIRPHRVTGRCLS